MKQLLRRGLLQIMKGMVCIMKMVGFVELETDEMMSCDGGLLGAMITVYGVIDLACQSATRGQKGAIACLYDIGEKN